jgi:lipid II:glycine glycyltransferase (peptidoglycan interpeptide bridge formation enzyme)
MRPASSEELEQWDQLVAANPDGGNALQTLAWGEFKRRWGWQPHRFVYQLAGGRLVAAQWLVRSVPLQGSIWYCPKGPGVTTPADYAQVVEQTRATLSGVFMRLESEVLADEASVESLQALGLTRANRDPGSKATIFIDLQPDEATILASFSQSTRRNLRKAQAAGVVVEPVFATAENLAKMYELMVAVEGRAHYGLRSQAYFTDYWAAIIAAGQAQLLFSKHEGEVLTGIFVTFLGNRAWYKDGGSFDKKRELQPSYLMQWEVMRWLKARGITSYDLVGVPPRDQIGTGHDRDSLYEFKRKFNPEVTEFVGCWDIAPSSWRYRLWRQFGERVATKLANWSPERFLY